MKHIDLNNYIKFMVSIGKTKIVGILELVYEQLNCNNIDSLFKFQYMHKENVKSL